VPIAIAGRIFGALTWATVQGGRRYTPEDLVFAEEVADRIALAIDKALSYAAEQTARAVAEKAVHVRDQFFSLAAHELKNPLTSLLGNTQLLERRAGRDGALSERDRRSVRTIAQQASRLNTLITNLLDVSRIEMGQLTLDRATLELGALVQRIVEETRPTLMQHTIALMPAVEPLLIEGDALRLEQVFQNLLSNAIKYSPEGGQVTVQVERQGSMAGVQIADQGIGIPAEVLPRLFQRFYRVESAAARQISGTGIGLYVVNEIVTLHSGKVTVTSEEGRGSVFTIWLPLAQSA
jgi:signal transduction histidine kinase